MALWAGTDRMTPPALFDRHDRSLASDCLPTRESIASNSASEYRDRNGNRAQKDRDK